MWVLHAQRASCSSDKFSTAPIGSANRRICFSRKSILFRPGRAASFGLKLFQFESWLWGSGVSHGYSSDGMIKSIEWLTLWALVCTPLNHPLGRKWSRLNSSLQEKHGWFRTMFSHSNPLLFQKLENLPVPQHSISTETLAKWSVTKRGYTLGLRYAINES